MGGVIAYFAGWAVGCATLMLVWYFSDIKDHSPYRRGYRDALFDMMKEHIREHERLKKLERERERKGEEDMRNEAAGSQRETRDQEN